MLRKEILTADKNLDDSNIWQKDIPYDTRQLAIKELVTAYKAAFANKKKGNITHFNVGYKSRKSQVFSFHIDAGAIDIKTLEIFKRRLKDSKHLRLRRRERSKVAVNYPICDSFIKYDHGNWYLCLVQKSATSKFEPQLNSVFLDPGVRTFQTFYSPDGVCGKLGDGHMERSMSIYKAIDKLQSLQSTSKCKTKHNIRKRSSKLRAKVRSIVNDLHNKSCHLLCNNFKNVFIPEFETKKMTTHSQHRKLSNENVRKMLSLGHFI